jgi:hypothetical protein
MRDLTVGTKILAKLHAVMFADSAARLFNCRAALCTWKLNYLDMRIRGAEP